MASKRIVLSFPQRLVDKPIVSELVRKFNLDFNILKAYITPNEEGRMVLEVSGDTNDLQAGLDYVSGAGVVVQPLSRDVTRNETRCVHCGACVPSCPSHALHVNRETMEIQFDDSKCMACGLCIKACPMRAMELHF